MLNTRTLKGGRDAYFTKAAYADQCVAMLLPFISTDDEITEPAAGNGEFIRALARAGLIVTRAYDIHPMAPGIAEMNWFEAEGDLNLGVVVTNPPFGHACSLCVPFFNHSANLNAGTIAFIVPQTFQKSSLHARLDRRYKLVLDETSPRNSFYIPETGDTRHVQTCFQVWQRLPDGELRDVTRGPTTSRFFAFVRPGEAWDWCVKRAGGSAGRIVTKNGGDPDSDYYIRSAPGYEAAIRSALDSADFSGVKGRTAGTNSVSKRELIAELEKFLK